MNRRFLYIVFGLVVAPSDLAKNSAYVDLLKSALAYAFTVPTLRNDTFRIAEEFEICSNSHPKLKTSKFGKTIR